MPSDWTVADIARDVQAGARPATEVLEECLSRIDVTDASIYSLLRVDRDGARQAAAAVDQRVAQGDAVGPLCGVPVAIKDNICTKGMGASCASKMLDGFAPIYDATVVEKLRAAGAVIVGKCNLDEFAMGSSCEHSAFGPTSNPWDTQRVAGGSSGGSAAAVAARLVPATLGSDTGGSIRLPASYCGVVGLKPSYGLVSRYGLVAFASSLDQIGPMTTNVADAAVMLQVLAGHDSRDSTSVDARIPDYSTGLDQPARGLRIGISEEYFGDGLDDEVRSAVMASIELMRDAGATVHPIKLPHMKYAVACYYVVASAEASSNLARYDGVHYGFRGDSADDIVDLYSNSRGEAFGAEVKRRIMLGTYTLSAGYYDAYYLKALKVRTLIKKDFESVFEDVDVVASPVAPTTAFVSGEKTEDPLAMYLMDVYTISANLAGLCAISVPCGFDSRGLPIGLQFMGPAFGEDALLRAAGAHERLVTVHEQLPPLVAQ